MSETFLIIRRNERDVITNVHRASGAVDVIFVKFEFSQQIFEKKLLLNMKSVFWFSLQSLSETFLIIRRNERDVITDVHRASGAVDVIVVKFEFSQQIFEKKLLLNRKSVFWFSLQRLSETFLIIRRNERDVITNVHRASGAVDVIVVKF